MPPFVAETADSAEDAWNTRGSSGIGHPWIAKVLGATMQNFSSRDVGALMQIRYSQDHQYITVKDGVGTIGITNYAQEKLSDVTTVELPHVGAQVQKGGAVGVIESVKAASELYSPLSRSTPRQAGTCQ